MVNLAKELKIKRFIYASSSSVYGIKEIKNVDETVKLGPKPIEADVIKLGKRKQISSSNG